MAPRDGEPAPPVDRALGGERVGDAPQRSLDRLLGMADELDEIDARGGPAVVVGKKSRTSSQTMSFWASPSTLESTVSIEAAPNRMRAWASRSAASKLSYRTLTSALWLGIGSTLSLASARKPRVPSEPHRIALRSKRPSVVADMGEVVAREAAVELGEVLVDQVRLVAGDAGEQAVDRARPGRGAARPQPAPRR